MEPSLHLFRMLRLERHDAAPALWFVRREGAHARCRAAVEEVGGQLAQSGLDVLDTDVEDQLEAGKPGVVRRHRPGSGLEPPSVVRPGEMLQRAGEGLNGREQASTKRTDMWDQLGPQVHEGGSRPA